MDVERTQTDSQCSRADYDQAVYIFTNHRHTKSQTHKSPENPLTEIKQEHHRFYILCQCAMKATDTQVEPF